MSDRYVRVQSPTSAEVGNDRFRMALEVDSSGHACIVDLRMVGGRSIAAELPVGPVVEYSLRDQHALGVRLPGVQFEQADEDVLCFAQKGGDGISVRHMIRPAPSHPAWASWSTVTCTGSSPVEVTRFDALNMQWSIGDVEPRCAYVLGWMEGPRADAPGRHSIPFRYDGWIPKFLYGDDPQIGPPPPGGWAASAYRLVEERLTMLPLRSGKRSTYENQPWAVVLDPDRGTGVFLGFEWSGTWRIDVEFRLEPRSVSAFATSSGCLHQLQPGDSLTSPQAFMGLFSGDWDDAFNASRAYVADEILPGPAVPWPTSIHCYFFQNYPGRRTDEYMRREIDAASRLGIETTYVEPNWWSESLPSGEFSVGLGDFADNRSQFPGGLRAMSDYVHSKEMNFGLWFEIERVDLRTCNRLRNPWRPEWLVHQEGHPYRSWCQHAFLLCLGVREAAEWALENVLWAIDEYNLDYIMFDGNEWAVCDDPTHDHGPHDGEWAQIHGYYRVMRGVREKHPDIMILNSSGGSQRGDFGIARYSTYIHPHDNQAPSARERRYIHGTGCMFPNGFQAQALPNYVLERSADGWLRPRVTQTGPPLVDAKQLEWRMLCRMMGYFALGFEASVLPDDHAQVLSRGLAFYRRIRSALNGRRYVPAPPVVLYDPEYREADNWEAYQFVSRDSSQMVVFWYRCLSPRSEFTVRLREVEPDRCYTIESFRGVHREGVRGADIEQNGLTCCLPDQRSADVYVLTPQ